MEIYILRTYLLGVCSFLLCDAMHSAAYAVTVSVYLSVRHAVVFCQKG